MPSTIVNSNWAGRASRPARPDRDLLVAWLLLLLRRRPAHGYVLRRELVGHGLDPDPAAIYRWLHKLEADGYVQSSWQAPTAGPPRPLYRLTPRGRSELREIVGLIAVTREVHDSFLRAHDSGGRDAVPDG